MQNTFVKYADLLSINSYNKKFNKDSFIELPEIDDLVFGMHTNSLNMKSFNKHILIRKYVYQKLKEVAKDLKKINKNYALVVVNGYRSLELQESVFNKLLKENSSKFHDKLSLYEYIHEKIAVPEVSGHPTGGAVDIAIYDFSTNKMLDFGFPILDYSSTKCYALSRDISKQAMENRKLLRDIMINKGFAPYDGEWWHFSFGDKEWAFYYNKSQALYNQISSQSIKKELNI